MPWLTKTGIIIATGGAIFGIVSWMSALFSSKKSTRFFLLPENAAKRANRGLVLWIASWLLAAGLIFISERWLHLSG